MTPTSEFHRHTFQDIQSLSISKQCLLYLLVQATSPAQLLYLSCCCMYDKITTRLQFECSM